MAPDEAVSAIDAVASLAASHENSAPIRHHFESRRGIPFARNKALEVARYDSVEWILFIDDDCVAAPDLLIELAQVAIDSRPTVVAGGWEIVAAEKPSPWVPAGVFGTKHYRPDGYDLRQGAHLPTAYTRNVLFNLRDIDALLPSQLTFNEAQVHTGGSDVMFFRAVSGAGGTIIYAEKAKVAEIYARERLTLTWHYQRRTRNTQQKILRSRHTRESVFSLGGLAQAVLGLLWRLPVMAAVLPVSVFSARAKRWVGATSLTLAPFIAALLLLIGVRFNEYDSESQWRFVTPRRPALTTSGR